MKMVAKRERLWFLVSCVTENNVLLFEQHEILL